MKATDELRKLEELRSSGTLNDEEFAAAKAAVLIKSRSFGAAEKLDPIETQIREAALQRKLERLDLEWAEESERFKFDAGGIRFHISQGASIAIGVGGLVLGLAIAWFLASGSGSDGQNTSPFLWIWGPVMSLPLLVLSVWLYRVAGQYAEANTRYEERREAILKRARGAERLE
jgi:hypothetical protein